MRAIFAALCYQMEKQRDVVLVTIIGGEGSAPRGTGSQMLVDKDGRLAGTIGGGAVEEKSIRMAQESLAGKQSALHEFLLHKNTREDIGMVCGGDVTVWFQYIAAQDSLWFELTKQVTRCFQKQISGWFVQNLTGGAPALIAEDGTVLVGKPIAPEALSAGYTGLRLGNLFVMPLPLNERAVIFGAGHIARALVPILKSVAFRPFVFDCRPDYAKADYFPEAEAVICGDYGRIQDSLTLTEEDYIVIMTNGHTHDFEVQNQVLRHNFTYVGVIGSQAKKEAVNRQLLKAGIPQDMTERVHTPIGTKIKAVTPAEIAVSIAGEMIYVRAVRREGE